MPQKGLYPKSSRYIPANRKTVEEQSGHIIGEKVYGFVEKGQLFFHLSRKSAITSRISKGKALLVLCKKIFARIMWLNICEKFICVK